MSRPKGSKNRVVPIAMDALIPVPKDDVTEIHTDLPIERWLNEGIPCKYARFINAVHPATGKDPVNEFKLESKEQKYLVNSLVYTPYGLIFGVHGEIGIVPIGNISHVRTV